MSAACNFIIRNGPRQKVAKHFLVMANILSCGNQLLNIRFSEKIRNKTNVTQFSVLDAIAECEDGFAYYSARRGI